MTGHSLDGLPCEGVPPELALYPYGCFTTFVLEDGGVLGWDRHLARLTDGVSRMWGEHLAREVVTNALRRHLVLFPAERCTVRVTIYPETFEHLAPERAAGHLVLVSSRPAPPPDAIAPGLRVSAVPFRRDDPELKSTGLTAQLRVRRQARLAGFDDALLVTADGEVLEGASWSVIALSAGVAVTPAADVLDSVTVHSLTSVLGRLGWTVHRDRVLVADLAECELVLAVNVNAPVRAITEIDGHPLTVDERVLEELAAGYAALPRTPI